MNNNNEKKINSALEKELYSAKTEREDFEKNLEYEKNRFANELKNHFGEEIKSTLQKREETDSIKAPKKEGFVKKFFRKLLLIWQ